MRGRFSDVAVIVLVLERWVGCGQMENAVEVGMLMHLTVDIFSDHFPRAGVDKLFLQRSR